MQKIKDFINTHKTGLIYGIVIGVAAFWGFQKYKARRNSPKRY